MRLSLFRISPQHSLHDVGEREIAPEHHQSAIPLGSGAAHFDGMLPRILVGAALVARRPRLLSATLWRYRPKQPCLDSTCTRRKVPWSYPSLPYPPLPVSRPNPWAGTTLFSVGKCVTYLALPCMRSHINSRLTYKKYLHDKFCTIL